MVAAIRAVDTHMLTAAIVNSALIQIWWRQKMTSRTAEVYYALRRLVIASIPSPCVFSSHFRAVASNRQAEPLVLFFCLSENVFIDIASVRIRFFATALHVSNLTDY